MDGQSTVLGNGVKLVGELAIPGASQMLEGRIGNGLIHTVVAGAAVALLGPIGGLASFLVRLNSYSSSINNRNLWEVASESIGGSSADSSSADTRPAPSGKGQPG